ncbi:protein TonB [Polaribacter pacificus]|uniref:Protein TonB n=1 Tax=Polaribacter pacificus TaxID=1775173 RepID=A0A917HWC8_9FLAO|nr:energy transducer TonB [Polaribacter pacificus]GGG94369.1 protein TonB [Polaribacter pacificus]
MEIKKNPKSNLENYSKLFIQLGLVLALFVVYVSMENKTYDKQVGSLGDVTMEDLLEEDIPITERVEPEIPKATPPPAPEEIEVVEDEKEVEETVIETTETDETEAIEVEDIVEAEIEEDIPEDVPFNIIEEVPVFPGCSGSKQELTDCLNEKIRSHVLKKFNNELAADLGLPPGKKKIYVVFRIDPKGNITEINARAPHPRLKQEAIRVAKTLPKMTPGKQRGKPVGMRYTLPISFNVE